MYHAAHWFVFILAQRLGIFPVPPFADLSGVTFMAAALLTGAPTSRQWAGRKGVDLTK